MLTSILFNPFWPIRVEPLASHVYFGILTYKNWTTLFPLETAILTHFGLQITHGYLYTPPGTCLCYLPFHLRRSLSTCHNALRDLEYKRRTISPKHTLLTHLDNTLFYEGKLKSLFWPKLCNILDFDFLLTKRPLFIDNFLTKLAFFDLFNHSMGKYRWKGPFLIKHLFCS